MISNILFLPHGMQIIPGVEEEQLTGFSTIDNKMQYLMKLFSDHIGKERDRDIILITPHGYNLEKDLVIYEHTKFKGNILKLSADSNVYGDIIDTIDINGNIELTDNLTKLFEKTKTPYQKLVQGYPDYPLLLNWGEVVPIYYLEKVIVGDYSIICYPRSRHYDLEYIHKVNKKLVEILLHLEREFTLVISGDLSHVHDANGPYGSHPLATEFDEAINLWSKELDQESMKEITKMQPDGLACGYSGLNLVHQLSNKITLKRKYYFYEVPTYFGMGAYWWTQSN